MVRARGTDGGERRVDAGQVTGVRHHDDHAAAGGGRGGGGDGDLGRPLRARQGRPGGPDRTALGQRAQERLPGWVPGPRAGLRPGHRVLRGRRGGIWCGRRFSLRGRVAGRDGQPEHVGQRARVPVRHRAGQVEDLRSEHGLGRDHPFQAGEPALVLAGLGPVQQVAVDELASEPDPDPAAGHGGLVHAGRDQVVEGPVEVGERDVDRHPGDRQPHADRLFFRALRHGSVLPELRRGFDGQSCAPPRRERFRGNACGRSMPRVHHRRHNLCRLHLCRLELHWRQDSSAGRRNSRCSTGGSAGWRRAVPA